MERKPHLKLLIKWGGGVVEIGSGTDGQWQFAGIDALDLATGFTIALEDRHGQRADLVSIDRPSKSRGS